MDVDRKEVLANASLVVVSLALVFASVEVGLQLTQPGPEEYPKVEACEGFTGTDRMQFHPTYGWTAKPGVTFARKDNPAQEWNRYTINDEGFRDTYGSGDRRAIVLGDSFTEGYLVDDDGSFPHLLDRWSSNVTYDNYGLAAYGTDQQLLVYRNVSDRTEHSIVVVGYYLYNDMKENVRNSSTSHLPRPRFAVRDGELALVDRPVRPTNSTGAGTDEPTGLVDRVQSVYRSTATYRFFVPRLAGLISGPPEPPAGEELDRRLRLTRAIVEEIGAEAERHDATVLVVMIPERGDVRPERPSFYGAEQGQPFWNAQREMLRDVAAERDNVAVLDLDPALRAEVERGNRVYGKRDSHLDDYGYRVVAASIHDRLARMGYVDGAAAPSVSPATTPAPEDSRCRSGTGGS